jgi:hypothetical protein
VKKVYTYRPIIETFENFDYAHPSKLFQLSWYRMKVHVVATALSERVVRGEEREEALAAVWQDVEMAFKYKADPFHCGYVADMWMNVGRYRKSFAKAITSAFAKADETTHPDVYRRYSVGDREDPFMSEPLDGISPVLGLDGVTTEAYCYDNEENYRTLHAEYLDNAIWERDLRVIELANATTKPQKKQKKSASHLTLLVNDDEVSDGN